MMNQYLLRVAGTHDPVAQKSKGTQKACTNVPQKALLYLKSRFSMSP
jgi:hypothetical protein